MAYKCVKIFKNGRWIEHYPQGRPTNAQRIQEYYDGVRSVQAAANAKAYAASVALEDAQTAELAALVIAECLPLEQVRTWAKQIRIEKGLTKSSIETALNRYKDFLMDNVAEYEARHGVKNETK